ncbi:MAG: putative hemolysin [Candidatus Paceibacteria bacterium]
MNPFPSTEPLAGVHSALFPAPLFESGTLDALPWALGFLLASFGFACLRMSLLFSRTARVTAQVNGEQARARMGLLLESVDRLASSANILKLVCELIFVALVLSLVTDEDGLGPKSLLTCTAIAGPALLFLTESLPTALGRRFGDQILLAVLPAYDILQKPVQFLAWLLDGVNSATLRVIGVPPEPKDTREIVEGLREVVGDSTRRNDLDATERELIENVMEFSDVDVAEIMTPRTEIHGVDLEDGIDEVVRIAAIEGHSSIPVYEENLDNIIGYISARGIVQMLAEHTLEGCEMREHLRPAYFVPETKLVSELLAEFRGGKRKMAVVLDEYGGTAGMVTLGDILGEIVGDIGDEFDREDPAPVRMISAGLAIIDGALRIAEVNEAMDIALSEDEDYESLGGFVLAQLGHFPKIGESFEHFGVVFEVTSATDRRVLHVRVQLPAVQAS